MRKTVCVLLVLAVVSLLFVTSAAEEADETSVYLEKTSVEMTVGGYGWLRSGLQNRKPGVKMTSLTWESTDEQVVTIDDESKYVAVGRGQAQLIRRIKTNDGKEYVGVCDVRVVIPVEEVVCDVQSLVLIAGKEAPLPESPEELLTALNGVMRRHYEEELEHNSRKIIGERHSVVFDMR